MRTLFIVLLLANLALFGFGRGWFGPSPSDRGREPARLAQEIQPGLISVPQADGHAAGAPAGPADAAPAPPGSAAVPSPSSFTRQPGDPGASPSLAAAADGAMAGATTVGASGDDGMAPGNAEAAGGLGGSTAPAGSAGAASVRAAAPATPPAAANQDQDATAARQAALPPGRCLAWGGFADAELDAARQWSAERLPRATVAVRRESAPSSHMVVVPPLESATAAQALAARLQQRGVNDLFVIQEAGPYRNGISLGVFNSSAGARRRIAALQGVGVRNLLMVERPGTGNRGWLVLRGLGNAERQALAGATTRFPRQGFKPC
ncbi:hypothetical protein GCM10023144_32680 [Pigmentiphaga soli]|uniref:SPOR domain-containing protein n=1 Tax=Pigmentiphaga soli TaxID=1007095 RepID=A0ABP8HBZ9_9BURK